MADLHENPLGTDGFEFIEYCGDKECLTNLFLKMGFDAIAKHKTRDITLFRQGGITFLLNADKERQPAKFVEEHGGGANTMAFRVKDADFAFKEALKRGAKSANEIPDASINSDIPALVGIGGSFIHLIDDSESYERDFNFFSEKRDPVGAGLTYIDHLTHNVYRGHMDVWAKFYEDVFNFKEIRYFDIEGKLTGLKSRAMTSPCGKIRIPLNESSDDKSQIEEYLKRFNGEGIQHIALGTDNIYNTVQTLKAHGVPLQSTPQTYYDNLATRIPNHGENTDLLRELCILVDGMPDESEGLLLQIFTQDAIGPVFFEIIQRKGNQGFGEGNFQALFESIEQDQINRGVLKDEKESA